MRQTSIEAAKDATCPSGRSSVPSTVDFRTADPFRHDAAGMPQDMRIGVSKSAAITQRGTRPDGYVIRVEASTTYEWSARALSVGSARYG
jgi:hypothetical protein